ncbi:MAG: gamma-glutamyltransferase [Gammaproteobacteria bacterium]
MRRLYLFAPLFLALVLAPLPVPASDAHTGGAGASRTPAKAGPPAAAIASAHPVATAAGFEILDAGGNAFDAAVAVSATLAVVEPYSSGLGGGGFWLLHRAADGRDVMVDGREKAPLGATRTMYQDAAGKVIPGKSIDGALAAGIPGEPAALVRLARRYGRLSLARDLAPAIRAARQGFKVTPHYRSMAKFRLKLLRQSPAAAAVFLKDNDVPPLGYVIRQPELARTLEALAREGRRGFYLGPIAKRLVAGSRAAGGIWSAKDLRDYRVVERAPVTGTYHGLRIVSASPPSSGGVALVEMLHILDGYDLSAVSPVVRKHLIIEAMRRAYRDRAEFLGDPDFVKVPVARLTNRYYAAGLREGIRLDKATPSADLPAVAPPPSGRHTTHFSILDREGNRVAGTLSINWPFGSAYMAPGTGVLFNDEMDDFSAKPGVPNVYGLIGAEANAIAPGKRPLSSMSPTFVEGPKGVAVLGTPGGSRIITMVLLGILDYADGHGPAHWVSLPRFHHQYLPDVVQYEPDAFTASEIAGLQAMGYKLKDVGHTWGNMQAVLWDKSHGRVSAASDPRGEGAARVN